MLQQPPNIVLRIGNDQNLLFAWTENIFGEMQQSGTGAMHRQGRTAESETNRIMGFSIQAKKGLAYLDGFGDLAALTATHEAFAVAADAMGIDGENFSRKVAPGPTKHPQMDLQRFPIGYRMRFEKIVHRSITRHERKTVKRFKSSLTEVAGLANPAYT